MTSQSLNPFARADYALLFAGLVAGMVAAPFNLRGALLPAALVFGWSQIGGL
jgi:hypothetical protein